MELVGLWAGVLGGAPGEVGQGWPLRPIGGTGKDYFLYKRWQFGIQQKK